MSALTTRRVITNIQFSILLERIYSVFVLVQCFDENTSGIRKLVLLDSKDVQPMVFESFLEPEACFLASIFHVLSDLVIKDF
jgi:hypothetical protein